MKFTDARDAQRTLKIVDVTEQGCWAELTRTAYIVPGIVLRLEPGADKPGDRECRIGALPPVENCLVLQKGDLLILTRDLKPGRPASFDSVGKILTPAVIGCTIPEVFDDVRTGESIWFDDGKISGLIEKVEKSRVFVRLTQDHVKPLKLRSDKGINLPQSDLRLTALTAKDIAWPNTLPSLHTPLWDKAVADSQYDLLSEPLFHNNTLLPCWNEEQRREFTRVKARVLEFRRSD